MFALMSWMVVASALATLVVLLLNIWALRQLRREWDSLTPAQRPIQVALVLFIPIFGAILIGSLHGRTKVQPPNANAIGMNDGLMAAKYDSSGSSHHH